ncbi:hypothetical protein BATDEDRAFT_89199 [Batrachochytrium dendrobatidis JAM81]|uniref:protein xylosyltransferase n=2 Tax=Batrachochytrium dendrobatidis TaxID=109871 RepID=F4P545_BATDJ|nr:uncharacterized protein BATDEDRAFT_89199 [Batrachochytrium dendrobatidis JAM81]EGF79788.1 hypothetical protein BATDEDRAFT_89199 [Batrachochytrium dendrobatidis JAM81]KAJ8323142.1 Xylosyltransferase 2 [Batrachochytrium dendrobatidis]KAK5672852.1 Xylosyltransferase 2 [Batrachochytrium dendrobatidis]OAJ39009.1 hypothetical protein BDEG_22892 [Batrachochytrium dendrobatidis JEL423]|eukprot:XP_006679677.1 hypothetical protein BATDEDRAFT_89199 [Batrachochytrium dendrobatidis JAM81]
MKLLLRINLWLQQALAGRTRLLRTLAILIASCIAVLWSLTLLMSGFTSSQSDTPQIQTELVSNVPLDTVVSDHISLAFDEPDSDEYVLVAGDHFYTAESASLISAASSQITFNASGFTFCTLLNGAVFDSSIYINSLGGSVSQLNSDRYTFVNAVDQKAHDIFQAILFESKFGDRKVKPNWDELKRLSCYFAAEGNSAYANFTTSRLLVQIEPFTYFQDRLKAIVPHDSVIPGPRRKYLIAYLLMVHEENGFPHLCKLIETLDDGDAIILIHVDNRPKSNRLRSKIEQFINQRHQMIGKPANIFLTKYRFSNIWGHSSLVFTQLSGFWELLDMADWDYVINLSNYDFPLKRNADIHRILSRPNNRGKNFIEYWAETGHLAERFYRAHIGTADFASLFHPNSLGVTSWPFPRWRAYKHHQWMIVTPDFIRFLRYDSNALNFLAFSEHTYIPDESYFATVLVNSLEFRDTVVNDNKRYLRFAGGGAAHPSWLGYKDRFLFPAGEPEPSFFFIRKMNVFGTSFEEAKLLEWISTNHMNVPSSIDPNESAESRSPCTIEDASVRSKCLKEFGSKIAHNNELVVVPVNRAFLVQAANLRCSLLHAGIDNLIYWSLDLEVHESLISKGKLSIFLAGFPSTSERQDPGTPYFIKMMRYKPKVLAMLLDAGFNVWYMDADTIALQDFRPEIVADTSVHIHIALDNDKRLDMSTFLKHSVPPLASAGIMYLQNHPSSKLFIKSVLDMQAQSILLDDQEAMRRVIHNKTLVQTSYAPTQSLGQRLGLDKRSYDDASNIPITPPVIEINNAEIHIRYFNQFQFINGIILLDHTTEIPINFDEFKVVHARPLENPIAALTKWGLWFLNNEGTCSKKDTMLHDARIKLFEQTNAQRNP